jgi:hypothetical protein
MDVPMALPSTILTAAISGVVALVVATITAVAAELRFRAEHKTDFAAERVARALLLNRHWRWRTFRALKIYLGGFEEDELRRILVRAGAVRSETPAGEEIWGLWIRNRDLRPPTEEAHIPSGDRDRPLVPGESPERPPSRAKP